MALPRKEGPEGYAVVEESEAKADPYPYVYVNEDGSARELHGNERQYLETRFSPMDGARPYVKDNYAQRNGWGEIEGFLHRSQLPRDIETGPAPNERPNKAVAWEKIIQAARDRGFELVNTGDGSIGFRRPDKT